MTPAEKALSVSLLIVITFFLVKNRSHNKKMNDLIAANKKEIEDPKTKDKTTA